MTSVVFKKVFICQIIRGVSIRDDQSVFGLMKSSVLGVISSIRKYSSKTVYTIDDGTGSIDCVLWQNGYDLEKASDRISAKFHDVNMPDSASSVASMLLRKIKKQEESELDYKHGDSVCCLGTINVVKGKLLLYIKHICKCLDPNAEALWILDVLCLQTNS